MEGKLIIAPKERKAAILKEIEEAQKSIKLNIFTCTDPDILKGLFAARKKGVLVHVIIDRQVNNLQIHPLYDIIVAGATVQFSNPIFTFCHAKYFVMDDTRSIVMTQNLDANYFANCEDYIYITEDKVVTDELKKIFERDSSLIPAQDYSPKPVSNLVFSPGSGERCSTTFFRKLVENLKKGDEVCLGGETTGDEGLFNTIKKKGAEGVTFKLLFPVNIRANEYERLKMINSAKNVQVRIVPVAKNKVGAAIADFIKPKQLKSLPYPHGKKIIARNSNTKNSVAWMGSQNFDYTSLSRNREVGIVIEDAEQIQQLLDRFDIFWKKSKDIT